MLAHRSVAIAILKSSIFSMVNAKNLVNFRFYSTLAINHVTYRTAGNFIFLKIHVKILSNQIFVQPSLQPLTVPKSK